MITLDSSVVDYNTALGNSLSNRKLSALNTIVSDLKTNNIWGNLDWLIIGANETANAGFTNLKTPTKVLTPINSPTFNSERGWMGNGVNAHLVAGETINFAGNSFSLNSMTVGVWITEQLSNVSGGTVGTVSGTNIHISSTVGSENNEVYNANDGGFDVARVGSANKLGHRAITRGSSTHKQSYYNGDLSSNIARPSSSVPAGNISVLRRGTIYSADTIGVFYSGGFMSADKIAVMHDVLHSYLSGIGAV
jgi:hypothetical protein